MLRIVPKQTFSIISRHQGENIVEQFQCLYLPCLGVNLSIYFVYKITCMLLSKLMAPSGPCKRGIPKADVWTGGKRIEPAPIPNMLWRPVTAERSPRKEKIHNVLIYRAHLIYLIYCYHFKSNREKEGLQKASTNSPNTAGFSKLGNNC